MDRIRQVAHLDHPPGSRFEYAPVDGVLLAAVVEAATGRDLPALIGERIAAPLGLDLTVGATAGDAVVGHQTRAGVPVPVVDQWAAIRAGEVLATPSDLVRWADNRRTGAVGGSALTAAAVDDTVATGINGGRYGAGVFLDADGAVDHFTWWPGFSVTLVGSSGRDRAIALACNDDSVPSGTIMRALRRIWFDGP